MKVNGSSAGGYPIACFFRFILEPRFGVQTLEIPRNFMRKHGDEFSKVIHLDIPSGQTWKLNLVIDKDGKAFLQKGWPEFVKFYSLRHGHYLIFKYKGNSCFEVVICDTSACEIEYPVDHKKACRREIQRQKNRKTLYLTKPSSSKKATKGMHNVKRNDTLIIPYNRRHSSLTLEEANRVRAYFGNHCKHPSYATKMQKSFVDSKFAVGISREFARKFLYNESSPCTFNLQLSDTKKIWKVRSTAADSNFAGMKLHGAGWKKFVLGNNLKVGDICIFELIKKQQFKVHIFRVANAKGNPENSALIEIDEVC